MQLSDLLAYVVELKDAFVLSMPDDIIMTELAQLKVAWRISDEAFFGVRARRHVFLQLADLLFENLKLDGSAQVILDSIEP